MRYVHFAINLAIKCVSAACAATYGSVFATSERFSSSSTHEDIFVATKSLSKESLPKAEPREVPLIMTSGCDAYVAILKDILDSLPMLFLGKMPSLHSKIGMVPEQRTDALHSCPPVFQLCNLSSCCFVISKPQLPLRPLQFPDQRKNGNAMTIYRHGKGVTLSGSFS